MGCDEFNDECKEAQRKTKVEVAEDNLTTSKDILGKKCCENRQD